MVGGPGPPKSDGTLLIPCLQQFLQGESKPSRDTEVCAGPRVDPPRLEPGIGIFQDRPGLRRPTRVPETVSPLRRFQAHGLRDRLAPFSRDMAVGKAGEEGEVDL